VTDDSSYPAHPLTPKIDNSKSQALAALKKLAPEKVPEALQIASQSKHPLVQSWAKQWSAKMEEQQK
jgi:hypothetical protein